MGLQWTDALAVGVPEIDHQHQELFRQIEQLLEGILKGDRTEVGAMLGFLSSYVIVHFGAEEELMRTRGYPGYSLHKAEHDRFLADFTLMNEEYRTTGITNRLVARVNRQVSDWLRDHIYLTDTALGRWIKWL
jgi:hemerythrin